MRRLLFRFFNVFRRERADYELTREMDAHLALLEDEHVRRGMTREDARRAARRAIGSVALTKDLHRDARSFARLDDALTDVKHTVRSLRRAPVFTAVAVMTLAIGVGDRLPMLQFSTYSVISPEDCASILWKSADKKEVAAEAMNLTADRLSKLKLVDEVLPEPVGGAHRNPQATADTIKAALVKYLDELEKLPPDKLRAQRNTRIDGFGVYSEVAN